MNMYSLQIISTALDLIWSIKHDPILSYTAPCREVWTVKSQWCNVLCVRTNMSFPGVTCLACNDKPAKDILMFMYIIFAFWWIILYNVCKWVGVNILLQQLIGFDLSIFSKTNTLSSNMEAEDWHVTRILNFVESMSSTWWHQKGNP